MHRTHSAAFAAIATALAVTASAVHAEFITLETPSLGPALYDDDWRDQGGFIPSGGALFNNFIGPFNNWSGFALSRVTDNTTPGFGNQYSAFAGSGASGSLQYAIGYVDSFGATPTITLPLGEVPLSIEITNTTYAGLSMRDGDAFAKKFGGPTGNDPDFFKLTISGLSESNAPTGSVDFYLADYRFANNALDYIVSAWTLVDLSSLPQTTRKLQFTLASSDNGAFGMNTPSYLAVDNLTTTVPEPAVGMFLIMTAAGLAWRRQRV
jgi:Domain of unknown function (DUF4465)